MRKMKLTNEGLHNLIETAKNEMEMALDMFWDHAQMLKDAENPDEIFEWIELSIDNFKLYQQLNEFLNEIKTNGKGKISIIKE